MEIINEELSCKGKSCKKKVLNISEALRHLNNNTDCRKEYTSEEIQSIRLCSKQRTDQKKLKRRRENYDPDERSEKHKRSYDAEKRKARYEKEKQKKKKSETIVDQSVSEHSNQALKEHKFAVIIEHIKLKTNGPAKCNVRHSYPLFGKVQFISPSFSLESGQNGDDENYLDFREHIVAPEAKSEEEIKTFLRDHPFEITLFQEENYLGQATIQLNRLYDPKSQKRLQKSFKENLVIKARDGSVIGTMGTFFVLVTEKCIQCRVCKIVKKNFTNKETHKSQSKMQKILF